MLCFLENFIINPETFSMVSQIKSHFLCILQEFIMSKGNKSHYLKETSEFLKIHTYKGNQG